MKETLNLIQIQNEEFKKQFSGIVNGRLGKPRSPLDINAYIVVPDGKNHSGSHMFMHNFGLNKIIAISNYDSRITVSGKSKPNPDIMSKGNATYIAST